MESAKLTYKKTIRKSLPSWGNGEAFLIAMKDISKENKLNNSFFKRPEHNIIKKFDIVKYETQEGREWKIVEKKEVFLDSYNYKNLIRVNPKNIQYFLSPIEIVYIKL